MSTVFLSRKPAPSTKESRKITRLSKRVNSAVRKNRESGPVTVIVYKG